MTMTREERGEVAEAQDRNGRLILAVHRWEVAKDHQEWLAARAAYYELLKELGGEE